MLQIAKITSQKQPIIYPNGNETFTLKEDFRYYYNGLIRIRFDRGISQDSKDAVLFWIDDEQGVLMEVASKYISKVLETSNGKYMLDPGGGSAILSLGIAKQFEPKIRTKVEKIIAIDVNQKAIEYAQENAKLNQLEDLYEFVNEPYSINSVEPQSAILIAHNVPYHPHNPADGDKILTSCSGGSDGQKWLRVFLEASALHLAQNGMIYGITKCWGNENPEFFDYVGDYFPTASIYWHEIYPPSNNYEFLSFANRGQNQDWVEVNSKKYSKMHHGVYIIIQDGKDGNIKTFRDKLKFTHNGGPEWHKEVHRHIQDGVVADSTKI